MNIRKGKVLFKLGVAIALILVAVIYAMYVRPQSAHKVFGVTYMTINNPFYEVVNNEIMKIVEKHNDKLITLDPALDSDKQNEQIHYFIEQKVDGIFVNPINFYDIEPALQEAKEAHIPVIVIDTPILNKDLANCIVVSDNYGAGVRCAEDMMSKRKSANIILLKHTTAKSAKDRIDGFVDTIRGNSNYRIINEGECEGQLELAMPMLQKLLDETPDVDVVMALNDPSALGAIAALESKGRDDVVVYGVDGTPDFKSLLKQNPMAAGTVAQSPIAIGKIAGEKMYDIMAGKVVEKEVIIPVYLLSPDNINEYNKKGWQ